MPLKTLTFEKFHQRIIIFSQTVSFKYFLEVFRGSSILFFTRNKPRLVRKYNLFCVGEVCFASKLSQDPLEGFGLPNFGTTEVSDQNADSQGGTNIVFVLK